jgi:uncharacterized repeat protein (TIGR02543 family)
VNSTPAGIDCGGAGRPRGGDCSETYADGTEVSLTAAPETGYRFAGWSGACSGTASCILTMDAAKSVTAVFEAVDVDFLLTVGATGHGTVSASSGNIDCPGACSDSYRAGSVVLLTPLPMFGETFLGWQGDCQGTGDCQLDMTANKTVNATFSRDRSLYALVPESSVGGAIVRDPRGLECGRRTEQFCYTEGTALTLTAVAESGFVFAGWFGDCAGTDPCELTVASNLAVTAAFAPDPDTDGDGIPDSEDSDDDGDGYSDSEEVEFGSDPLDPGDVPATPGISPAIMAIIGRRDSE